MIEDRIYLFIYLVYISCLGDKKVRCLWGFSDLRVYGLEHQGCTIWNIKGVRFGTGVQFGTPRVYSLEHQECTVWNTKSVQFGTPRVYGLEHQGCTIWNIKGVQFGTPRVYGLEHQTRQTTRIKSVQFCTPILLIKTHEYFLWNRIEFRCKAVCTFKMVHNTKKRIA